MKPNDENPSSKSVSDVDPAFGSFKVTPSIPASEANFPGAEVLAGGAPAQIHARLIDGDPLGVSALVLDRMEHQAILWDPVRILRASMARIAHDSWSYRGEPALLEWLNRCIDKAVQLVLQQAEDAELRGVPAEQGEIPCAASFIKLLGIEPHLIRRAVLEFQTIPLPIRRTFQAILLRGTPLEAWSAAGHGTAEEIEDQIIYAAEMLKSLGQTNMPCPPIPGLEGQDD